MQNSFTGEIQDIGKFLGADFPMLPPRDQRDALQAACDKVEPDRTKQGPIFTLHEIVEIKGGRFEIIRIGNDYIRLKSLPAK